jgi:hypothetical protein
MTTDQLPFDDLSVVLSLDDLRARIQAIIDDYGYDSLATELRYFAPGTVAASAPARWTDPETSHAAAKREQDVGRFSSKSRQAKLLELFQMRDLTDQQATIHLVGSHAAPSAFDGCRRRCSDLRAAGYLFDTGRRRKNAGSEDLSIIWGITEAGQEALRSLDATGWSR